MVWSDRVDNFLLFRTLLAVSTLSMAIATVHVVISFLQLLHAFTTPSIIENSIGPSNYLSANMLEVANAGLYIYNVS